jgi:hypothetical protein
LDAFPVDEALTFTKIQAASTKESPRVPTVGKPWDNRERDLLIRYWQATNSIVLTALLLGRTTSAIQTAASRFNLPKRTLDDDTHRRPWSGLDEANWLRAKRDLTRKDGRLPLDKAAVKLQRSVDSVANRLLREVENDTSRFLDRIVIPSLDELDAFAATLRAINDRPMKAEAVDPRKVSKMRKCLSCEKPFWSHDCGNRICNKCKDGDN